MPNNASVVNFQPLAPVVMGQNSMVQSLDYSLMTQQLNLTLNSLIQNNAQSSFKIQNLQAPGQVAARGLFKI